MGRMMAVLMASAMLGGCASAALRSARAHVADGELAAAAEAAGQDRGALSEVSVAVLAASLGDEETRLGAERGLALAGSSAEGVLQGLLAHEDPVTSCMAASLLLRLGHDEVTPRLEACVEAEAAPSRVSAVGALGGTDAATESFFRAHLGDEDPSVRAAALEALATRGDEAPFAAALAAPALRDDSARVRAGALLVIAHVADHERVTAVAERALDDEELPVRLAAVEALGGCSSEVAAAGSALEEVLARGEGPEATRAAAHLARQGHQAARAHLAGLLVSGEPAAAAAAALAAGQAGEAMVEPLREALERPEADVRLHVATALVAAGQAEAGLAELAMLLGEPGWVGLLAAAALVDERPAQVRHRLEQALEAEDEALRAYAASSSAWTGEPLPLAALALGDPSPRVRVAAATAILRALRRV